MRRLALIASALCFAVALLLAVSVFHGAHQQAWLDGGLLALVLALALPDK